MLNNLLRWNTRWNPTRSFIFGKRSPSEVERTPVWFPRVFSFILWKLWMEECLRSLRLHPCRSKKLAILMTIINGDWVQIKLSPIYIFDGLESTVSIHFINSVRLLLRNYVKHARKTSHEMAFLGLLNLDVPRKQLHEFEVFIFFGSGFVYHCQIKSHTQ